MGTGIYICEYFYYVLIEDLDGFHMNIKIVLPLFSGCIVLLLLHWFCLSAVRLSLRSVFATAVALAALFLGYGLGYGCMSWAWMGSSFF